MDYSQRKILAREFLATVPLAGGFVMGGNARRVGLLISAPQTNLISLSFKQTPVLGSGLNIAAGISPVYLYGDAVGSCIKEDLWGIAATGNTPILIIEFIDAEK